MLEHTTSHYSETPNSELFNETDEALSDKHFDALSHDDPSLFHEHDNENKFSGRKTFCCPTTAKGWCAFKVRLWFNDPCVIVVELKHMKHILHDNHNALQSVLGFDPGDLENFLPFINFILENINDVHTKPQYNLCPRSNCPPCEISTQPVTYVPGERCPPMIECPLICPETSCPKCPEISSVTCPTYDDILNMTCQTCPNMSSINCSPCPDISSDKYTTWPSIESITCPSLPPIPTCPPQSQNCMNIPNYPSPPPVIPIGTETTTYPPPSTIPTCPETRTCPPQIQNWIKISNFLPAPIIYRCPEYLPEFPNWTNISKFSPPPINPGCPTCPPPPSIPTYLTIPTYPPPPIVPGCPTSPRARVKAQSERCTMLNKTY
ncbi:hypothetical protein PV327_007025 [Microctonus hyperodae]|uniref:Uncharacterized protein n=1 Tax=Microctonus hyperodae TaxID=165561 RepID=A0AA39KJ01_MICHY|nr:hypothetical protein PV327_007025 [Microctonus hyperodae]